MTGQRLVLGIDEAGRGPVLGPMVIGAVLMREEKIAELKRLGVKDSKKLTAKKRAALASKIRVLAERLEFVMISPNELDEKNLNDLTRQNVAQLIKSLAPNIVLLDAPVTGRGINRYVKELQGAVRPLAPTIIAKNKADVTESIVSAASIIAKVKRDQLFNHIARRYEAFGSIGSGYASDAKTKLFLARYLARFGDWPPEARRKWETLPGLAADFPALIKPEPPPLKPRLGRPAWLALGTALATLTLIGAGLIAKPLPSPLSLNATASKIVGQEEMALVTKVIDGDTLTIEGGRQVRLLGIDAPEFSELCFADAKKRLEQLALRQVVRLLPDVRDTDKYDRLLRFAFVGERNVNLALIKEGLAVAYFFDDRLYKKEIQEAEKEAIANKTGCLWRNL